MGAITLNNYPESKTPAGVKLGVSLFSSGGVADLAAAAVGVRVLVANELRPERAAVYRLNFPETNMIVGDINEKLDEIIGATTKALNGQNLDFLLATPPCQGMSKNGRGKLLAQTRLGKREKYDPRNRLIIPALKIINDFRPEIVVFENVPEIGFTNILIDGNPTRIPEFVLKSLPDYTGAWETVDFADYGIPQRRRRTLGIFTRNKTLAALLANNHSFVPPRTHSQYGDAAPWVTLREAIGHLPPLDAADKKTAACPDLAWHRAPLLSGEKYFWVKHTPEGRSAFDNQCAVCGYDKNKTHRASKTDGVNRTSIEIPLYCEACGNLLPRPWVNDKGKLRIMRGYTSAYKRMLWDAPAPALTRNLSYACSDNKLHPEQNRVLSLREAFILHTIDQYEYVWKDAKTKTSDKTVREIIGESVPPKGLEIILAWLFKLRDQTSSDA